MGVLNRYKKAKKDKGLKKLIWFDRWLLICFGLPEIRDLQEEARWLRSAFMDESDGSGSGSDDEDEDEEEDSEDEEFENEVAEAEEDIQEAEDDDDDGCDMDLCDDEQNENAKDFEEMEQGYIDEDDDREKEESDEYDVDAFDNPASKHADHIDDHVEDDDHAQIEEIHEDPISASDTILDLDASVEPVEINHDYVYI
ncbi:Oidioi.mRNA.OKI2018_I69.PAR.g8557.t1.cds [Oikopleura dioica]|uniref:Oidioi.mRNA.OKI2018_I69.PAR.g8557.t1.cds n=1 Tax=Oikopleura dioica TaxID=34765 RepID=A0ABN7RGI1_OIKDI|nr:Oidioi.mRNA.OKI2018_I69.PAR.g8557.t1.cds [Oikopleura dioica]